ncbi:isoprenylcysteine carboxylmethyltransferase family protein [Neptuniibacter sp.]|uniref:methyltransferase family protein n=1 Tax=Neptuniibacter sp. TaxID=1962643 RepID=UPI002611E6C8|nr:isoprenylcysteine carboxylmethyltransferase family protein [Neptuniibacter sp.]MCP4597255.1 isoprenylcysteine carboxylmethyltransferase family protein [Neptuniibacter sp.]
MSDQDNGPGVKIPPPLIFITCAALSYAIEWWLQVSFSFPAYVIQLGVGLIALGITLAMISAFQFWKFKTHIEPWKPASVLINTGVFAYSRNPIYLAFVLVTSGTGLYLESIGIVLSNTVAIWLLYYLVITKEETYLEALFGEPYSEYKKRVRRWL